MRHTLIVMIAALAVAVLAIAGTLAIDGLKLRRIRTRQPLLSRARADLLAALLAGSADSTTDLDTPINSLENLSRSEIRSLVLDLSESLGGESSTFLRAIADRSGVSTEARARLRSRRWSRRIVAARILAALGEEDPDGGRLLWDLHPVVRAQAATWVGAGASPEVVERLLDLVGDPDGLVRFAAKNTLIGMGDRVGSPILERLEGADLLSLHGLLEVAATAAAPIVGPAARRLTEHDHRGIRALSATVLGRAGGTESLPVLENLLADPDPVVRAAAVAAFGDLGQWPAAPLLAHLLGDAELRVRKQAALTLIDLGAPGVLMLRDVARTETGLAADLAVRAIELHESTTESVTG